MSDESNGDMLDSNEDSEPTDRQEISLDKLSEVYAELLDKDATAAKRDDSASDPKTDDEGAVPVAQPDDEPGDVTPRSILEAMFFVGNSENTPLSSANAAELMRDVKPEEIDQLVRELNGGYANEGCPYQIVTADTGYRLVLREEFSRLRDKFYGRIRQARLSQAAIDVLAIVAYNQPLSRPDVDQLRGKPSGTILNQLVRRHLLKIDRPEDKPRTKNYQTTERFLDLFRLDSLNELPQSQELDKSL